MSVPPHIQVPRTWLAGTNIEYFTDIDDGGKHCAVLNGYSLNDFDVVFIVKYDHVHNRFFFVNKMTREKSWELPDASGLPSSYHQRRMMNNNNNNINQDIMDRDYAKSPPSLVGAARGPPRNNTSTVDDKQLLTNEMANEAVKRDFSPHQPTTIDQKYQQQQQRQQEEEPAPRNPLVQLPKSEKTAASYMQSADSDILDVNLLKHETQRLAESLKDRDKLIAQFQNSFSNHQTAIRSLSQEVTRLKTHPSISPARASPSPERGVDNNNSESTESLKKEVSSLRLALEKEQEKIQSFQQQQETSEQAKSQQELIETLRKKLDQEISARNDLVTELNQSKQSHHHEMEVLKKSLEHQQERDAASSMNGESSKRDLPTLKEEEEETNNKEEIFHLRKQLASIEATLSQNEISPLVSEMSRNNSSTNLSSGPTTVAVLKIPAPTSGPDVVSVSAADLVNKIVEELKNLRKENANLNKMTKIEVTTTSPTTNNNNEQQLVKDDDVLTISFLFKNYAWLSTAREESAAATWSQMESLFNICAAEIRYQTTKLPLKETVGTTDNDDESKEVMMNREHELYNLFEQDDRTRIVNEEQFDAFPTVRMTWKVLKMYEKEENQRKEREAKEDGSSSKKKKAGSKKEKGTEDNKNSTSMISRSEYNVIKDLFVSESRIRAESEARSEIMVEESNELVLGMISAVFGSILPATAHELQSKHQVNLAVVRNLFVAESLMKREGEGRSSVLEEEASCFLNVVKSLAASSSSSSSSSSGNNNSNPIAVGISRQDHQALSALFVLESLMRSESEVRSTVVQEEADSCMTILLQNKQSSSNYSKKAPTNNADREDRLSLSHLFVRESLMRRESERRLLIATEESKLASELFIGNV